MGYYQILWFQSEWIALSQTFTNYVFLRFMVFLRNSPKWKKLTWVPAYAVLWFTATFSIFPYLPKIKINFAFETLTESFFWWYLKQNYEVTGRSGPCHQEIVFGNPRERLEPTDSRRSSGFSKIMFPSGSSVRGAPIPDRVRGNNKDGIYFYETCTLWYLNLWPPISISNQISVILY